MTTKMSNITNFEIFYNEVKSAKLPLKTAFKLSNLSKAIEDKLAFYREKLQEILLEYGQLDENGNIKPTADGRGFLVKEGMEAECMTKLNELLGLEVELPDISFDVDEFGNIEISVEVLNIIIPFLKEE